jgi:hypothetical protein
MNAIELKRQRRSILEQKFGKWLLKKRSRPTPHVYQPVENYEEINQLRNSMATGNYPLSMTDCDVCGINGDCGPKCPALLNGSCTDEEMLKLLPKNSA